MSITWEFRPRLIVITTVDAYTNDDLVQAIDAITRDARFSPGLTVIFDGQRSTAPLTKEDVDWRVNALANDLWRRGFGRRMALVVPADRPARYGVGRMLQMMTESKGFEIEIFRDLDEALRWGAADLPPVERQDSGQDSAQ